MNRTFAFLLAICLVGCVATHPKTSPAPAPPVPATEAPSIIFPTNLAPSTARTAVPAIKSALAKVQPLTVIQPTPKAILLPTTDVGLTWQSSTDVRAVGYNLYYGSASRQYTDQINAGTNLSALITGLIPGQTYYIAATDYDVDTFESDFSDELIYVVPQLLEMTFDFLTPVSAPTIQASSDFLTWTNVNTKTTIITPQSVTVRAVVNQDQAEFFRAFVVTPLP